MKKGIFILCCFFAGGCTVQTIAEPPVLADRLSPKGDLWPAGGGQGTGMSRFLEDSRLTRINSVRVGMTSREVAATMGEKTTIDDVLYYFSHIQRADGIISSDELTPLVFEKDILIGKGWDFFIDLLPAKQNVKSPHSAGNRPWGFDIEKEKVNNKLKNQKTAQ
ncbi:MAG: DUF3192 domain-containing protein [Candidatus Omnitrophica bacterium]|nr:DUF3192 domain-containing protein [Candidatus Omnitrophota bacterium]